MVEEFKLIMKEEEQQKIGYQDGNLFHILDLEVEKVKPELTRIWTQY